MNFESEFRKAKKDYAAANNQVEDLEEAVAGNEDAVRINTLQSEATTSVTAVRRQVRAPASRPVSSRAALSRERRAGDEHRGHAGGHAGEG